MKSCPNWLMLIAEGRNTPVVIGYRPEKKTSVQALVNGCQQLGVCYCHSLIIRRSFQTDCSRLDQMTLYDPCEKYGGSNGRFDQLKMLNVICW